MDRVEKIMIGILIVAYTLAFAFCIVWGYAEYVKLRACSGPGFKPAEWTCGQRVFP